MHAGIAGVIILPVAGVTIGIIQVVRGAINTPEAIRASLDGRTWDMVGYLFWSTF